MKLSELRALAAGRTLFSSATLEEALTRLRFVQADPIRAPARAQDLILRLRAPDYRAGQLESRFDSLDLVEDTLHVYGFLPRREDAFLHPRRIDRSWSVDRAHPHLRRAILAHVRRQGTAHPRDLHEALGRMSIIGGWGQESAATTRVLEVLHYEGRLRVVRRESGIKVYGLAGARAKALSTPERARELLRILVNLYAPLSRARLLQVFRMLGERAPRTASAERLLEGLEKSGELRHGRVDGIDYVWPDAERVAEAPADRVHLLAPFDPIVWDRQRFEHLWGWRYRFEAYTPAGKRQFGYYALPLLWRDAVIGWANVTRAADAWQVSPGFVGTRPRDRAFERGFDAEIARLERFLAAGASN